MSDDVLIQSVLSAIKLDDVGSLGRHINEGVNQNIQLPPKLYDEPEFLRNGAPLICTACYFGSRGCLEYLVGSGADISVTDDEGLSAPFYAAAANRIDIISLLAEFGCDIRCCGQAAIRFGHADLFEGLVGRSIISIGDRDLSGSSYLHTAAFYGDLEITKLLLKLPDPPVSDPGRDGRTPLHLAAGNGFFEICQYLMKSKADPTVQDAFGRSPLYYGASQEHYQIVELMLGGPLDECLLKASKSGNSALCRFLAELNTGRCQRK
jgi:ankyrin repeat protein